jgi:hypothetical protein
MQCKQKQANTPFVPLITELDRPFGKADKEAFQSPPQVCHPETWFHFISSLVFIWLSTWAGVRWGIEGKRADGVE